MASDPPLAPAASSSAPRSAPRRPRRLLYRLLAIAAVVLALMYVNASTPHDQHVRLVLGGAAAEVMGLELRYETPGGEMMRTARMAYDPGRAPRVVAHDPHLADGEYRLMIDVDTREGRRSVERRVTLGGGTTQIDLAGPLAIPSSPPSPSSVASPSSAESPPSPPPRTAP